ncbi:hypothetical protein Bca52824_026386 [Brassica carinata]|uniref:Dynamin stalk domain-containing protein n=1 Tax=Brassica carinata TaxID=52824 RepID=A0A8X7SGD5_BRACI|nr:hypothetical protein Bca52824_026386 [Brassica carinata]
MVSQNNRCYHEGEYSLSRHLFAIILDIMDKGTDARNLLAGKVVPLRLGYVGVVNRCQDDILLNRSVKEALRAEEKFFQSHPTYHGLASRLGIPQLAKKLNQILVQHIKALLPDLKSRISNALVATAKKHQSYEPFEGFEPNPRWAMMNLMKIAVHESM